MAAGGDEELITRLHDAFAQNMHSRSEVRRVRGDLAATINSYIVYEDGKPVRVKQYGEEITGLRRRHLEALKANLDAQEQHRQVSGRRNDGHEASYPQLLTAAVANHKIILRLEALSLRRQHQELRIWNRYARILSEDASKSCNLNPRDSQQRNGVNEDEAENLRATITISAGQLESLNSTLEKAILQANNQLQQKKRSLLTMKEKYAHAPDTVRPDARVNAVAKTRGALVAWLDEKLSESGADHGSPKSVPAGTNGDLQKLPNKILMDYQIYLEARREVLSAAAEASSLLSTPLTTNGNSHEGFAAECQVPDSLRLQTVHAISARLAPLLHMQADMTAIGSYSHTQSARERQITLETLRRLADESHLLSAYPDTGVDGEDELASNLSGWQSAVKAAVNAVRAEVHGRERAGTAALMEGENALAEVRSSNDQDQDFSYQDQGIHRRGIPGRLEGNINS